MEEAWTAVGYLVVAYLLGLVASFLRLPPLVGYLGGGLALYGMGATADELLEVIGEVGVLLLLFTLGLHIRLRSILRPEVLGVGSIHLAASAGVFTGVGLAFGLDFATAAVIAVVMGFSSTVLVAKMLQARTELEAHHGRIAIGILIWQDIVAIAILAISGLESPSWWALLLLLLPLVRPLLLRLMVASKHDELLVLYGVMLTLGGGVLFEVLGLGSELGALAVGVLLAGHSKSDELAEKLWGLKEVFLVGFFLEIGLGGLPPAEWMLFALVLLALLPFKGILYFLLAVAFKLRARTGFMVGTLMAQYSEFALIAGSAAVAGGLIPQPVLAVLALVVLASFALSAPLSHAVHSLYARFESALLRFERATEHPAEAPHSLGKAHSLVVGMGRTGTAAYDTLIEQEKRPVGLDSDPSKIDQHRREGRQVIFGDAEDPELWENVNLDQIETVILAVPDLEARVHMAEGLRKRGFTGVISTISMYPEEDDLLREAGADLISHPLSDAGSWLAEQSLKL